MLLSPPTPSPLPPSLSLSPSLSSRKGETPRRGKNREEGGCRLLQSMEKHYTHLYWIIVSFSDKKKHIYQCKHSLPLPHILRPLRLLRFVLQYSKVTVTNPSRLKCLPSKSRFQAELQLCVEARESSDERRGRLWAVELLPSECRVTVLTSPGKGPRCLALAVPQCFRVVAACSRFRGVPGDSLQLMRASRKE